jgi:hypothetical protein
LSRKGQTSQDEEEEDGQLDCSVGSMLALLAMGLMFLLVLCLLLIPVAMITVGAYFYEECAEVSPYPLWLVVGGAAICAIYIFFICMGVTECFNNLGVLCLFSLLLIFPLIWYVFGCWYLWGVFTRSKVDKSVSLIYSPGNWVKWENFQHTDCIYPYWVVYSLVVTPLALIGLGVGLVVVFGLVMCFTTNIDDVDDALDQEAGTERERAAK